MKAPPGTASVGRWVARAMASFRPLPCAGVVVRVGTGAGSTLPGVGAGLLSATFVSAGLGSGLGSAAFGSVGFAVAGGA